MNNQPPHSPRPTAKKAHVIVVGNEKGGSGKSTVAMHLAVALLRLGYRVGTIDLDSHQATLTHYLRNRWAYARQSEENLPTPEHIHINRLTDDNLMVKRDRERRMLEAALDELSSRTDYIVMDTPGSDRFLSIMGHSYADTLVTPMNDSFIDLDLLAQVDPQSHKIMGTSIYTDMVQDLRAQRLKKDGHHLRWFVMRNRLGHVKARNRHDVGQVLETLAPQLDFQLAPGLGERVIYRELFLKGLTLLDIKRKLTMAHVTGRHEVRHLVKTVLPEQSVSTLSLLNTA